MSEQQKRKVWVALNADMEIIGVGRTYGRFNRDVIGMTMTTDEYARWLWSGARYCELHEPEDFIVFSERGKPLPGQRIETFDHGRIRKSDLG